MEFVALNRSLRELGEKYRQAATVLAEIEDTLRSLDETEKAETVEAIRRQFDELYAISDDGDFVPYVADS